MEYEVLCQLAKAGDWEARAQLVEENLTLVLQVANGLWHSQTKIYKSLGLAVDDFMQEGAIGLLRAIEHFDVEKSVTFRTYAAKAIRNSILDAIEKQKALLVVEDVEYTNDQYQTERVWAKSPEQIVLEEARREDVRKAVEKISPREQVYLTYRFGLDGDEEKSIQEAAEHFHLGVGRAKKLEKQALQSVGKWL